MRRGYLLVPGQHAILVSPNLLRSSDLLIGLQFWLRRGPRLIFRESSLLFLVIVDKNSYRAVSGHMIFGKTRNNEMIALPVGMRLMHAHPFWEFLMKRFAFRFHQSFFSFLQ